MRNGLLLAMLMAVAVSSAPPANAEAAGVARVPVVTRLVRLFSDLEGKIGEAVARQDDKALAGLVGDDFEMRTGSAPGRPIPRAAWMQQSFAERVASVDIGQMAVHDYGEVAVVSFLWKAKTASIPSQEIFVVDAWSHKGESWKLTTRYADPAAAGEGAVPGAAAVPTLKKAE